VTAPSAASDVWLTCADGEVTEVFAPAPDQPCMRGIPWIRDGRAPARRAGALDGGIYHARYTWDDGATTELSIALDPAAPVVLIEVSGETRGLACRFQPRLDAQRVWFADGVAWAEGGGRAIVLLGVGVLVCLDTNVDDLIVAAREPGRFALGFGASVSHARAHASEGLARAFPTTTASADRSLARRSAEVLATLAAKHERGAQVAALATPWGPGHAGSAGTYHVVWTRDLVQGAIARLAIGDREHASAALAYLARTQRPDGRWPQSMRIDGSAVGTREELDEAALPVLLLDLAARESAIDDARRYRALVHGAAELIARTGPATSRDRWEDASGITPYTLATEIAALVIAGTFAERWGDASDAQRWYERADAWWHSIDRWLYRSGGPLAARHDVPGYYVRARHPAHPLPALDGERPGPCELSLDVLALVRLGLRDGNDARIAETCRVVDAVLAVDLPAGRAWHRYPGDRYGEHADGSPWRGPGDHDGIGRAWPLFTGERAHYELARGDRAAALRGRAALEAFATPAGYLPEQVWDAGDVPPFGLVRGAATGSAAPLGWAHAEYLQLRRSIADGAIFARHACVYERYVARRRAA
jgi:glucoamylase